jgi:hypothetical protein
MRAVGTARARPYLRRIVLLPAGAVLSLVGGLFPSFSPAAYLYILVIGGLLTWLGLSGWLSRSPVPRRLSRPALWWLLPAGLFAVVEAVDYGLGSTYAHPTVSLLMDGPLDRYPARAAAYFAWLYAFWGLVRR